MHHAVSRAFPEVPHEVSAGWRQTLNTSSSSDCYGRHGAIDGISERFRAVHIRICLQPLMTAKPESSAVVEPTEPAEPADPPKRQSRVVFQWSDEVLARFIKTRQDDTKQLLGVAVVTPKRRGNERGVRWPHPQSILRQTNKRKVACSTVHTRVVRSRTSPRNTRPTMVPPSPPQQTTEPPVQTTDKLRELRRLPVACMDEEQASEGLLSLTSVEGGV